jgi:hypothetical protein
MDTSGMAGETLEPLGILLKLYKLFFKLPVVVRPIRPTVTAPEPVAFTAVLSAGYYIEVHMPV